MNKERYGDSERLKPSQELANAIRNIRRESGLSKHAFAAMLNCDYTSLFRWEEGQRVPRRPTLILMLKMAAPKYWHVLERHLGKTLEQILHEEFLHVQTRQEGSIADWSKQPERHVAEIHAALTERVQLLHTQARIGQSQAARSLLRLLELSKKLVQRR